MNKKISLVVTMALLLVMLFSICAIAEYGVNENYTYHLKCLQGASITYTPAITPLFTTSSAGAGQSDLHMDCNTVTAAGTLVESVEICHTDGTATGVIIHQTNVPVSKAGLYIDRHFFPTLNHSTPYKAIFESDNGFRATLTQIVMNYN